MRCAASLPDRERNRRLVHRDDLHSVRGSTVRNSGIGSSCRSGKLDRGILPITRYMREGIRGRIGCSWLSSTVTGALLRKYATVSELNSPKDNNQDRCRQKAIDENDLSLSVGWRQ
jgi:hypothetical protein